MELHRNRLSPRFRRATADAIAGTGRKEHTLHRRECRSTKKDGVPDNYYSEARGTPWFMDGTRFDRPEGAYSTDLISDFISDFIISSSGESAPFFIYVSHYAPHWPLQADEADVEPYREIYENTGRRELMQSRLDRQIEAGPVPPDTELPARALRAKPGAGGYLESERMALHAAMVASIDRGLAETMAALEASEQLDNTLILVFSDNGASDQMIFDRKVPEGLRPGSGITFLNQGPAIAALNNTPLRGYKTSNYEDGIASPLVAWWPRGIPDTGRVDHGPHHITDIMPTCLELTGIDAPAEFQGRRLTPLVGESLVPAFSNRGSSSADRVIAWKKAIRRGPWKLHMAQKRSELYPLSEDRNERNNLADQHPGKVRDLARLHRRLGPARHGRAKAGSE